MNKIPTVYVRNPQDRSRVLPEVNPDCQWVLDGEGVPTRKYDGHCTMFDGHTWWSRREVKPGKMPPRDWVLVAHDEVTGKSWGWEPSVQSPWAKYLREALLFEDEDGPYLPGTYELIGPRINGNPEDTLRHTLVAHVQAQTPDQLYDANIGDNTDPWNLVKYVGRKYRWEGVVWHHPDGRMAKLKARDLRGATDLVG